MSARVPGLQPGIAVVALCCLGMTGGCATAMTGSYADETTDFREQLRRKGYTGYPGHWGWHEPDGHQPFRTVFLTNSTRGTLGIDIFDNETGRPVWHGRARQKVPFNDRVDPEPTLAEGIDGLFAALPD